MSLREIDRKGWGVIALSVLGISVSVIPIGIISLSVLIKPLAAEFGWSRGAIGVALTLVSLGVALGMPVAGRLIDRFGTVVSPMIASIFLLAAVLVIMPSLIQSMNLVGFYIGSALVGFLGAPASSIAFVKVITAQFDKNRGFALGFGLSGVALGGAILPFAVATIVKSSSWSYGFYFLAIMPIIVGLPVALLLPKPRPQPDLSVDVPAAHGASTGSPLRNRVFWMLVVIFFFAAATINGIQLHMPPLLSDRGLGAQEAAAGLSLLFIVSIVARMLAGYLFDHVSATKVGAACFLGTAVGVLLLGLDMPSAVMLLAVVLIAFGSGAEGDLLAFLVGKYFDMRSFGKVYGYIFGAFMLGSAVGPAVIGIAFDAAKSYAPILLVGAAVLCAVALLNLLLPRYRSETAAVSVGSSALVTSN